MCHPALQATARALRPARLKRSVSPYQPKAESSTKAESKTDRSIYNVRLEPKKKEGVKRRLRCVSRADAKPLVACCFIRSA